MAGSCEAKTLRGKPCKRAIKAESKYCAIHSRRFSNWQGLLGVIAIVATLTTVIANFTQIHEFVLGQFGEGRASDAPPLPIKPPRIVFDEIPPSGDDEGKTLHRISGRVHGLKNASQFRVVIYAFTDHWYVQPFVSGPLTTVTINGEWQNRTHLGSSYAAILVEPSFQPEAETDAVPAPNGRDIHAYEEVVGSEP